jgi:hypothetical protein
VRFAPSAVTSYSGSISISHNASNASDPLIVPLSGTGANVLPAAPANLTADVVSKSAIDLTWVDNANDEKGFMVEVCQGAGCSNFAVWASLAENSTTYRFGGGSAGTTYRFRVRAYNGFGYYSAYSNIVQVTTPAS